MSDTEGALPGSGAHDLRKAEEAARLGMDADPGASRLPTAGSQLGDQLLPSSTARVPVSEADVQKRAEAPPKAPGPPVTETLTGIAPVRGTLDERLAAATLQGGLTELPAGFGDSGGDWVTARSSNPFEVLYLDYRQASRITPEIVSRHRDLLQRFWQEKLRSMTQGAARLAILKKYGGEDESDRLVRSYPELIDRAFHCLSTIGGIEETYCEIVTRQRQAVFARINEKLNDFLVDSVLQPEETKALLAFAVREGVEREVVAAHVQERLHAAGLVSDEAVSGATIEQQLLSSAWIHPSRKIPAPLPVISQPHRPSPLLLSLIGLVLIVGVVLLFYRTKSEPQSEPADLPAPSDPVAETEPIPPAETASVEPEGSGPDVESSPTRDDGLELPAPPSVPHEKLQPPEPETSPSQPVISQEERRVVQGELEAIRTLGETEPEAALGLLQQLDSRLAGHPQEFADERLALVTTKAEIQTSMKESALAQERKKDAERREQERLARYEQSLAQIASMSQKGNFSGARDLAEELLKEPDLPEPIAIRARELADDALRKLQDLWSGAKVKSKTKRSADPPQQ